jgi:multidrug resistance protein, MATE family
MARIRRLKRRLRQWVAPAEKLFAWARDARSVADKRPRSNETSNTSALPPLPPTTRAAVGNVVHLSWPIAAAMVGESAIGLVDTKLVGGLGAAALGGVGIATMLMFLNYAFVMGMSRGVKVATAHAVGRGSPRDGIRYTQAGVALFAIVGAFVWSISRDITWVLRALAVDPELYGPARLFLAARTYGAPATCVLAALIQYRQAIGDSRSPMIIGIGGNVINAFLAYSLIYGRFGFPALGVEGAGYGTAITEWLEVSVMLWLFSRDAREARRTVSAGREPLPFRRALAEVCALGVPTGFQFGAETLAFTVFTAILGGIGGAEIAANQVAISIIRVAFLPGIAVAEAASVLVGQSLGQRNLDAADRFARASILVAVAFMAFCGVVFALFGGPLAESFTSDDAVARIARKLLLVAAVFQVLDAVNIVLRGALRGAKDVRAVALIGIGVVWICVPGAAYLLGKVMGLGALGGWLGFIGETTFSAALFWLRWTRGAWRVRYSAAQENDEMGDTTMHIPTT